MRCSNNWSRETPQGFRLGQVTDATPNFRRITGKREHQMLVLMQRAARRAHRDHSNVSPDHVPAESPPDHLIYCSSLAGTVRGEAAVNQVRYPLPKCALNLQGKVAGGGHWSRSSELVVRIRYPPSPVAMGDDDLTHHKDKNSAELKFKIE